MTQPVEENKTLKFYKPIPRRLQKALNFLSGVRDFVTLGLRMSRANRESESQILTFPTSGELG